MTVPHQLPDYSGTPPPHIIFHPHQSILTYLKELDVFYAVPFFYILLQKRLFTCALRRGVRNPDSPAHLQLPAYLLILRRWPSLSFVTGSGYEFHEIAYSVRVRISGHYLVNYTSKNYCFHSFTGGVCEESLIFYY